MTYAPGTIVRFRRCGGINEAEVIGLDVAPAISAIHRRRVEWTDPRYLARATTNNMIVAFTESEVVEVVGSA